MLGQLLGMTSPWVIQMFARASTPALTLSIRIKYTLWLRHRIRLVQIAPGLFKRESEREPYLPRN